jgi:hypothetical protein
MVKLDVEFFIPKVIIANIKDKIKAEDTNAQRVAEKDFFSFKFASVFEISSVTKRESFFSK